MRKPSPLHLMRAYDYDQNQPQSYGAGGGMGISYERPMSRGFDMAALMSALGGRSMGGPPPPTSGGGAWPSNPYPIAGQPPPTGGFPGQPPQYPQTPTTGGPSIPTTYRGPLGARMTGGQMGDQLDSNSYLKQLMMMLQGGGY